MILTDKICEHCGKLFENATARQKYCHQCGKEMDRQYQLAYQRALRSAKPEKFCLDCGKSLAEYGRTVRKRCPECVKKHKAAYKAIQNKEFASYRKSLAPKPKPVKLKKRKKPIPHCWDLDCKTTMQLDIESRALGLSIGKYEALCNSLFIERYLNSEGVYDGLDRADKAWKDFQKEKSRQEEVNKAARANSVMEMGVQ